MLKKIIEILSAVIILFLMLYSMNNNIKISLVQVFMLSTYSIVIFKSDSVKAELEKPIKDNIKYIILYVLLCFIIITFTNFILL